MRKTIAYYGTAGSRSEVVLSSRAIQYPYRVLTTKARFAPGTQNLLRIRLLLAADDSTGTGASVSGVSMLGDNGQVDYLVGDNDSKTIDHEVIQQTGGSYLKVHATNDDWYDHAVDVQITIETLTP